MSIERFLEILDRTRNGPLCTLKEWNTKVLPGKISQKLKEHGLHATFDHDNPINTDDALAAHWTVLQTPFTVCVRQVTDFRLQFSRPRSEYNSHTIIIV